MFIAIENENAIPPDVVNNAKKSKDNFTLLSLTFRNQLLNIERETEGKWNAFLTAKISRN